VTDLRDQLADFEAAAPARVVPTCHPNRPAWARHLCRSCYEVAWKRGTLHQHPAQKEQRCRADFVADYRLLRSLGLTRPEIAARLGMTKSGVNAAYYRARDAGELPRERLTRMGWAA
jgi:hypothetical protein